MRKLILAALLSAAFIHDGFAANSDQYISCERAYRAEVKAAKASAPAGFVPAPDKNRKPNFMLNCLAKDSVAAK